MPLLTPQLQAMTMSTRQYSGAECAGQFDLGDISYLAVFEWKNLQMDRRKGVSSLNAMHGVLSDQSRISPGLIV